MIASHGSVVRGALTQLKTRLAPHAQALVPGLVVVALMLVWAVHDGGYDADTWYWGALVLLGLLTAVAVGAGVRRLRVSRATATALAALTLYVAWSYLSIAWAQAPGVALEGANRALLYLILFTLLAVLPWTAQGALIALLTMVLSVGVIAIVMLVRLASADHVASLVIDGRLAAPTGYFNSTAALFTMNALAATALAVRRELPRLLRAALITFACAGLQLALIVQSRGWLFTLPLVAIATILLAPDRLRVAAAALIPAAAVLAPLHRLLQVFRSQPGAALDHAAHRAGQVSLLICAAMFVGAALIAWGESAIEVRPLTATRRRALGLGVTAVVAVGACTGAVAATHGHPFRFLTRQWNGFTHPPRRSDTATHFTSVGSGRYDFWRLSLDAVLAHPIGGLGQDNYADYYVSRRRTGEEPRWTHSLELRLLAHTGFVGLGLFALFIAAALSAALDAVRRGPAIRRAVAGAALLPMAVWLIHGSVDWFWELPALTAPALGFLAITGALRGAVEREAEPRRRRGLALLGRLRLPPRPWGRLEAILLAVGGTVALLAAVAALGFSYLSVREFSLASDLRAHDTAAALREFAQAAEFNPLNADPGRLGGVVALQAGLFSEAERRFRQAIDREPGGWLAWLGDGLAASQLGDSARAHHDFEVAASINRRQSVIAAALERVYSQHPLTPAEAFGLLVTA
jgi:hypothetical protein